APTAAEVADAAAVAAGMQLPAKDKSAEEKPKVAPAKLRAMATEALFAPVTTPIEQENQEHAMARQRAHLITRIARRRRRKSKQDIMESQSLQAVSTQPFVDPDKIDVEVVDDANSAKGVTVLRASTRPGFEEEVAEAIAKQQSARRKKPQAVKAATKEPEKRPDPEALLKAAALMQAVHEAKAEQKAQEAAQRAEQEAKASAAAAAKAVAETEVVEDDAELYDYDPRNDPDYDPRYDWENRSYADQYQYYDEDEDEDEDAAAEEAVTEEAPEPAQQQVQRQTRAAKVKTAPELSAAAVRPLKTKKKVTRRKTVKQAEPAPVPEVVSPMSRVIAAQVQVDMGAGVASLVPVQEEQGKAPVVTASKEESAAPASSETMAQAKSKAKAKTAAKASPKAASKAKVTAKAKTKPKTRAQAKS
ncbi:MAG: hypothetical protein H9847_05575, partial [Candidatus Anaerobiospirillum pullicola]|nr:hypothetical protein [Candidatus Anaerobiospirillum pullicola]